MKFFFSAFFLFAPFFLFSQKFSVHSIVITKTNDSLHLLTADKELRSQSSVKTLDSASKAYRTYRASEISELIIGADDYYKSAIVTIDQTPYNEEIPSDSFALKQSIDTVFLKTEYTSNNIKLYSLYDKKRSHFFIQKDNGPFEELIYRKLLLNKSGTVYESEDRKFVSQLSDLLADCLQAVSSIKSIGYTTQAIEEIFDDYNRFCHKENVARYSKTYKAKFEISALAGISLLSFNYSDASGFLGNVNKINLASGISPVIGGRFNYIPALLHSRFSITGDLYFSSYTASSSYYSNYISSSDYTKNTMNLKNGYINLAIAVRYYFIGEKSSFRPFINVGYLAGLAVSTNNKMTSDDFFNGSHTISQADAFPNNGFKNDQYGFVAGAGIIFKKASIDYRYLGYTNYLLYQSKSMTAASNNITLAYRLSK